MALCLSHSVFSALVVLDPCSSLSATLVSLVYSSCPIMAIQAQLTICLSIQETFIEHLLYFRPDSGYHAWGTMQKTR